MVNLAEQFFNPETKPKKDMPQPETCRGGYQTGEDKLL